MDAFPTPHGDGNLGTLSIVVGQTLDAFPTPHGDGNKSDLERAELNKEMHSLPLTGTETSHKRIYFPGPVDESPTPPGDGNSYHLPGAALLL